MMVGSSHGQQQDQEQAQVEQEHGDLESRSSSQRQGSAHLLREAACIVVLCTSMLLTQSGLSQTVFILPTIGASFGVANNPGQQSWFAAAYSLTVGTFVLPAGRLGDMFGHRKLVQIGFLWYAVWEMVGGLLGQYTKSYVAFDFARGMIGIGPAILLPNSIAILGRLNAPGSTAKMISFCLYAATAPNGSVLGGTFAALLARNPSLGWYWSFYIFAFVLLVIFGLTFLVVPNDAAIEQRVQEWVRAAEEAANGGTQFAALHPIESNARSSLGPKQQRHFDWLGTLLGVSGLILFNFAFNQAFVVGWQTVYTYVLLIVGVLLLLAFIYAEAHCRDPLVPLEAFTLRTSLVLGCVALGWSSFGTWFFYSVRIIQELRHHSELSTVAQFAPCGVAGIIAAFGSVFLLKRISPALVMLGAMCAFCAGNALVATMPINQIYWIQMFIATVVTPFGMDMSFPSGSIIISDALPPEKQGVAGSLVNTIVNYSIAFGLGLAGTVESQVNDGGADAERGFRGALYLGIGLAGLGIICALCLWITDVFPTANKRKKAETVAADDEKDAQRGVEAQNGSDNDLQHSNSDETRHDEAQIPKKEANRPTNSS